LTRRRDENASRRPSGLQRGTEELNEGLVSRRGGEAPSEATVQTSLCRRFSLSMTNVRTNATVRPSGEMAAPPTDSMR
jgi:hypothetical protein